jgi:hypothetical protein
MHTEDDIDFVKQLRREYGDPTLKLEKGEVQRIKEARADRQRREDAAKKELDDYLNRGGIPVPDGAIMTASLGRDIRCRTMRSHPNDFANDTVALIKATPELLERFGLSQFDTVEDPENELGSCLVLGGTIAYEAEYMNTTTSWNTFTSHRTEFKPMPWYTKESIVEISKSFADGDRVRRPAKERAYLAFQESRIRALEEARR